MPTPTSGRVVEELLQVAREVAGDPYRFTSYADSPTEFVRDVLGVSYFWSRQEELLLAARDHARVSCRSGHGVGKSFGVACLILWWLYARRGRVISTGPTKEHVEDVLWSEVHSVARAAPVPLPGEYSRTEIRIDDSWYATGLTTNVPDAFQGRHHPRLLVVCDEAAGVPEPIHERIATLATDPSNRIVLIGNPTLTSGTFYEAFKHPEVWHPIAISCLEHPNVVHKRVIIPGAVSVEWVEERRTMWGEAHPFWAPRVLGQFPSISIRGIIPLGWVERAQSEERRAAATIAAEAEGWPLVGGLDVARYGENVCALIVRKGDAVLDIESWNHTNLMETTGRAVRAIKDRKLSALVVDASGIGAGVADRLLEQGLPIYAYNGGHRAFTPGSFANRRSEMWWHLRTRLEKERLWLPRHCPQLVADLVAPEYEVRSAGRIHVETKEALLKRGVKSPDFADALVLCFALDDNPDAALEGPPDTAGRDPLPMLEAAAALQPPYSQFPDGF